MSIRYLVSIVSKRNASGNFIRGIKSGNLAGGGALTGVEEIMVLDRESRMIVNSCLEHMEGEMRLKKMWKFVP